ncbi:MFS transporter [Kosakonia arachidis]|uniref:MFS transporter n=1 Tax=Kosakonia arachidis TaxID=551989 RepID=UPI00349ED1BC
MFSLIFIQLGTEISLFSLPIFAITQLHVTPVQMGCLVFSEQMAPILLGIFSGIFVDRHNSLKIMIASEIFRAPILIFIFITFFSQLSFLSLFFVCVFLREWKTIFFDISYRKLTSGLFESSEIIQCNAKLASANSLSELLDPVIAGCIIKIFSVADALFFNVILFLLSSLFYCH